jgi:uncharacterized protein YdeI (YjbR/CyaY-like superfamily)
LVTAGPHGYELVHLEDRAAWRRWLERHHATAKGVWLVSWRPQTGKARVDYDALVEEALCFGWIDGHQKPVDDERIMQLLTPRRPGSAWASSNKRRVARLDASGVMTAAGRRAVEAAKVNGSWSRYDSAEAVEIPSDLTAALAANPVAARAFTAFTDAGKRAILRWLIDAKRPETRAKRIAETVQLAAQNKRAGP